MVFMLDILSDVWCFLKNIPQPIATLVASAVAVGVTWRFQRIQAKIAQSQADTAKNKLRLELYERRYALYEAVIVLINVDTIVGSDVVDGVKIIENAKQIINQSRFLFNGDIIDFNKKIITLSNEILNMIVELKMNPEDSTKNYEHSQIRSKKDAKIAELHTYIDKLEPTYAPYLSFETIK